MYARSYYPEGREGLNIPEKYDGTAFNGSTEAVIEQEAVTTSAPIKENGDSVITGLGKIPILSSLFGGGSLTPAFGFRLSDIGTEEILIIAAAAFLFFSKEGDKESALLLLILLFIK